MQALVALSTWEWGNGAMSSLVLQKDNAPSRIVRLDDSLMVIGRSVHADLTIDDGRASRRHAQIRRMEGEFILEDLESRNGTYLNGTRIDGPQRLKPGDQIEIGQTRAVFDPHHATAVSVVEGNGGHEVRETTSGIVRLGDEGTLLGFKTDQTPAVMRRDPLVRLKIIYHFADRMRRCFDLNMLLQSILDGLFEVMRPDRAAVLLVNRRSGELESAASRSSARQLGIKSTPGPIPISSSIVAKAVASRSPIVSRDIRTNQRFSTSDSIITSHIGSAVCVPMISGDDLCGLLFLDFMARNRSLDDADLELLAGLANQSAMAIGNSLHHAEEVERREIELELDVARRVHDRLLSSMECDIEGIRVRSMNRPSRTVGGDYLGVFPNSRGVTLAVADGTGHGIGAALLMGTARAYLLALLDDHDRPMVETVSQLNRLVYGDVESGLFVSLGLLRIDAATRQLTGVSAGHEPALIYRASQGRFVDLPMGGTVLGLDPEAEYVQIPPLAIEPKDRIILFTDGIVEQTSVGGEEFGFQRFRKAIALAGNSNADKMLTAIIKSVDDWRGDVEQNDDYSLMIVEVN